VPVEGPNKTSKPRSRYPTLLRGGAHSPVLGDRCDAGSSAVSRKVLLLFLLPVSSRPWPARELRRHPGPRSVKLASFCPLFSWLRARTGARTPPVLPLLVTFRASQQQGESSGWSRRDSAQVVFSPESLKVPYRQRVGPRHQKTLAAGTMQEIGHRDVDDRTSETVWPRLEAGSRQRAGAGSRVDIRHADPALSGERGLRLMGGRGERGSRSLSPAPADAAAGATDARRNVSIVESAQHQAGPVLLLALWLAGRRMVRG
jgi:hypothetical protein